LVTAAPIGALQEACEFPGFAGKYREKNCIATVSAADQY